MKKLTRALALCVAFLCSVIASAATTQYRVLIDSDNSTATGCPVNTPAITVPGIDHVLITTVDTTSNTITKVERQTCVGGTILVDAGGWSDGANSDGSQFKIETYMPVSAFGATLPTSMHLYFIAGSGATASAVTTNANGTPVMWPPVVGKRHASEPPNSNGTTGRTIVLDGDDHDWAGLAPLVNGAASFGNSSIKFTDISVFATSAKMYFLFRVKNDTSSAAAPTANNDVYGVKQGHTLSVVAPGVLANDSDPASHTLTAAVVVPPGNGSLNLSSDGGFSYTNNPNFQQSDTFQYKANNGSTDSAPATVTINVSPDNPPKANADGPYSVAHAGTLNVPAPGVLFNDADIDGDVMTAVLNTPPAHGTLTLNSNGGFKYVHDGTNTLSDSFTYKATDGIVPSTPATVSITIGPDAAPVANNDAYTVAEGGTLAPGAPGLFANDTDADTPQASWTINIVANPTHGTLTPGANGTFTYVHDGSETISDSFTYQVNDGILLSNIATVSITITPVNDAPVAVADSYNTNEDQTLNVVAPGVLGNDTDAEGNAKTASVVTNPTKGTLTLNPDGSFQYVPNPNANGTDTFTYKVTDNGTTNGNPDPKSSNGTVTINIAAVNDVPTFTAGASTITVNEDSGAYSAAWATAMSPGGGPDEAGQTLNFIVSNNNNGLFSAQPAISPSGTLTFTPAANANGSATVSVQLHDNGGTANGGVDTTTTVNFTIVVNAVNDAPSFTKGANQTVAEDAGAQTVNGWATALSPGGGADEAGQTLNFIVSNDNNALFSAQPAVSPTGTLTYTPAANASGSATVSVQIHDNGGVANGGVDTSVAQTFTITVTAVNDAPVITRPAAVVATEDTQFAFNGANTISVADVDGGSGSETLTLSVAHGTLNLSTTTGLTVSGNSSSSISADGTLTNLNAALATLTYTPALNWNSGDTLNIGINDNGNSGSGGPLTDSQQTTIAITPVNDAPVFTAGGTLNYTENDAATPIDTTITVSDVDNANLASATAQITGNYVNGEDVLSFTNTPNIIGSFNAATGTLTLTGSDTLANYQAALRAVTYFNTSDNPSVAQRTVTWIGNDGAANSAAVTSTINVTAVNDAPVVTAGGTLNYTENQAATAIDSTITITDADSTNLTGATAQITGNYVNGEDILSFTNTASITGTFNAATGTMTLTGTDTLANYQTALRSVKYSNPSDNPSAATRTVTWQVNDGAAANNLSNQPTSTINVTPVNDAPAVTAGCTLNYTENDPASVLCNTITVSDVDNSSLTGATVTISGNFNTSQGVLSFTNTPNITGSYNAGTGVLTLSGTDTVANYQAALRTVKYQNTSDNPTTAARSIDFAVNDGTNVSNNGTVTVNITAVNDAPVLTAGGTLSYTENQVATAIDTTITITDVDSPTLTGATAQITANYVNGEDILSFTNTANITGSFNAATGTLTLTGSDTVANYQTALRNVQYNNTSENPSSATRTVTWQVNDGGAVANLSNTATSSITVTPVNDAPVVTAGGTLTYTEADPASVIDNTVTVTDVDSTTAASATVQITANYINGQDILSFTNTANITGSFNAATGTMTLTGVDTLAAYQAALRSVKYNNTSTSPSANPRTVTWIVNDGTTNSAGATSTINVISVNTAPTITAGATLNYTENQAATAIDTTITVTDPDTANMAFATAQITANYVNGQDVLSFTNTANITGSFNAASGTLTLTGSDTVANYVTALRSVKYANTSDNPTTAARTVSWQIDDGDSSNHLSNTATSTINVTAVNDAPTLSVAATLNYTENDPATAIAPAATVTDPDNTTLTGGTVQITANYVNGQDILSATNTGSITASFNAATGTLTLTGTDTLANYQTVLRSVKYANTSENPSTAARTVSWIVTDGTTPSSTQTTTINVTSVNDAPVLTAGGTLNYTENQAATAIDTTVTASDVDNANLASATIQITGNYVNGEDVLSFTNTANITGSFNAATGTMTLTGSDTVANYQTALRNVKYTNTSDNPSTLARTVSFTANDGSVNSNTATSTINVTAVNDAPTIVAGNTLSYTENQAATALSPALTLTDPDSANITTASAQITANYVNGQDILSFTNTANITGSFNAATGTMTLTGTDTVANYQTALRAILYNNTSENPSSAPRTVTWLASDGVATSSAVTSTINVTNVNDAPVLTAGGTLNYTENQAATAIDTTITASDVDSANFTSATVQITANYVNGQDVLSFTNTANITGSFNAATGTLTLTGSDTVANYQTALRNVKYANTSDNPSTAARTVSWQVNDGGGVNNLSNVPTSTINVTSVNDAPVVTAGGTLSYTENQVATAIDTTITVTDADTANLTGATAQITANYVNGEDILSFTNTANITGTFNAATGTMTLAGTDTVANYQAALRAIKYNDTSENPSTAPRTVSWQVNDGQALNNLSTIVTSTINVTSVNDRPVVTAGATLTYTENDPATAIDTTITVTDVDNTSLTGATVTISTNYQNGQDVLSFTNTASITGSFNAATGVLTLTGTDTLANYQAALRNVKYTNTSENPSALTRTIDWVVNDGQGVNNLSIIVQSHINVIPVNDPPVIANTSTLAYTENNPATAINTVITVTDVDSTNLTGATIQITTNYNNGQDVLSFTNTASITGSFNAATGTMTLTGSDTVANYQTALRNVKYNNTSDDPTTAARTVVYQVNDGGTPGTNLSNTINSTINVTAVNDPPTAFAFTNLPAQAGIPITYPAGKLGGTDLEAGTTITIDTVAINKVNIASLTINANGSFTVTPTPGSAGGTASFDYRVSDNGNPAPGVNGSYVTVSFAVAGPAIYFVKNPAVGTGDCTLGNECTISTAITNIGANINANIFLEDANTHTPAAAVTLNPGGSIIGQGVSAIGAIGETFNSFDTFFGINAPAQGVLAARPSIGLAKPTVAQTITLNTNSKVRGFNETPGNNASGIVSSAKTGLQIDLGTITTNTPGGPTTYALDISGASGGAILNVGAINANGGGAGANGVRIGATFTNTGTFSTINTTLGKALDVSSSGATNFTFGNITSTTGAAVSVATTSGNFTFANVTTTTGTAITTSSTGAGNFSFGTVGTTTGQAISVTTGTGAFTFTKITSGTAASGPTTGIHVQGLTGSFTVNGTGGLCDATHISGTDCTGGTIQKATARGAEFISSNNVTLNNMYFKSNSSTVAASCTADVSTGADTNCNGPIFLQTVGGGATLSKIFIDGSSQMGIVANGVAAFNFQNSEVTNVGSVLAAQQSALVLQNLSGTNTISGNHIHDNDFGHNVFITINTGTATVNFTNNTVDNVTIVNPNASDGSQIQTFNSANVTALVGPGAGTCSFNKLKGNGVTMGASGSSTLVGTLTNCTANLTSGTVFSNGNTSNMTANVTSNTITNKESTDWVNAGNGSNGISIGKASAASAATFTGVINGNHVMKAHCGGGCIGIDLDGFGQGTTTLTVTNNDIHHTDANGLRFTAGQATTNSNSIVTIQANNVTDPDTNNNYAVDLEIGPNGTDAVCTAMNVGDMSVGNVNPGNKNTVTNGAGGHNWVQFLSAGAGHQGTGCAISGIIYTAPASKFRLFNYTGSTDTQAQAWFVAANPGTSSDSVGPYNGGTTCP